MQESDDAKFRRVIEKSWADEAFRKALIGDPGTTLKA